MARRRGRFAPTPSGELHIGNVYTALLAWLQIRQKDGQFIMRMEDIDKPRSRPALAKQIVDDLKWLGIDWDEGPDIGGPYGPYTQSQRLHHYEAALDRLKRDGRLYPCYCSRAELLAIASAPHGLSSEGPAYPGTCRTLTPEERAAKSCTKTPSFRFQVYGNTAEGVSSVKRHESLASWDRSDFVVQRADGIISYQLAVVVDDALMKVTNVLRGSDLFDSTPRQLLLYEALGYEAPDFVHVPLLYGNDGKRLAKRHGDFTIARIRASGCPAERLIGFIAKLCGLHDRTEPISAYELIPWFDLGQLPKAPITVDASMLAELLESSGG
ncbi:tRNA glutamyl-Q(34) synthetase GluQRS [Paenibacillus tarimensis]